MACWFNSSTEYLAHGSPPAWWFLGCVPFSSVVGPIRDVYRARSSDPAARKDSDPFAHHPAQDRSGSWVSRPTGVADGLSGPSAPELPEPHQSPPPLEWGSAREICQEGRRKGVPSQRDDRLGFEVRVREGREVIHAEVPPRRGRLKDPRLNGNADLVRPRTEGRLNGLEHSGLEGALRLSGLVLCLSLLRGGLGLQEFWRGPSQSAPSLSSSFSRKRSKSKFLRRWPPSPPPSMAPWSSWRTVADRSTAATWSAFLASSWAIVVALSRVWILKAFTAAGWKALHSWPSSLSSVSHTRILVASDNQGNVFSLLNDSTRRMPNAAILMEIVLTLHDQQVMLGPSHVKCDFNTWADELTHPDPQFPTENRVFPSVESELIKLIFATFLPHP